MCKTRGIFCTLNRDLYAGCALVFVGVSVPNLHSKFLTQLFNPTVQTYRRTSHTPVIKGAVGEFSDLEVN